MPFILDFDDYHNETALEVGGKGFNLCRLRRDGHAVPAGFCVKVDAFDAMLAANPALGAAIGRWLEGRESRDAVAAAWQAASWPEDISNALDTAVDALDPAGPLAVRSSAIVEDSAKFSFAGQFDTRLGVVGKDALRDALTACWASLCTETLLQHATAQRLTLGDLKMAVVVQKMIAPRAAGVLFTVDPLTQNRERLRIEASYGLGEALVSGEITPDSLVVEKTSGAILEQVIAPKATSLVFEDGAVSQRPVAKRLREASSLSAADVAKLTAAARALEAWAGKPQDIEWAFDGDRLCIVQSRDITTLEDLDSALFTPPVIEGSWTRENMAERYYKPGTPFTISTLYPALEKGLEATFERIGLRPDPSLGPLIRVFYGRPYLNKTLATKALKGIKVDKTQMETVLGERQNVGFNPRLPLIALGVVRMISRSGKDWDEFQRAELDPLRVFSEAELSARTLPELHADLTEQLRVFQQYWIVHMTNVRCADFCQKIVRTLLDQAYGDEEEAFETFCRLSAGFTQSITCESDAALYRLSRLVLKSESLAEALRNGSHEEFQTALRADPIGATVSAQFESLIARFGNKMAHQEFRDLQWRDSPELVWQHIAAAMDAAAEDPRDRISAKAEDRESAYAEALARFRGPLGPVLRPAFKWAYRRMCEYIPFRENDQFHFGKLFYAMRRTVSHMGRRLVEAGALGDADDIFFLELEKIPHRIEEAKDLKGYVARQRARFERYEEMAIPYDINDDAKWTDRADLTAGWAGHAVSRGIVSAVARIAHDPSDLGSVGRGEVLVTHSTSPAWTPAFGRIAALVTESGGMLSHGAIMAREYNIPAVLGVRDVTSKIASGDSITVNGTEGVVSAAPKAFQGGPAAETRPAPEHAYTGE